MYLWVPILPLYIEWIYPGSTVVPVAVVVAGLVVQPMLEVVTGAWADHVGGRRAFLAAGGTALASSLVYASLPLFPSAVVLTVLAVGLASTSETIVSGSFDAWYDRVPKDVPKATKGSADLERRHAFSLLEWWRQIAGLVASLVGVGLLYTCQSLFPSPGKDMHMTELWYSPFFWSALVALIVLLGTSRLRDEDDRRQPRPAGPRPGTAHTFDSLRLGWEFLASSPRLPAVAWLSALNWSVVQFGAFIVPLVLWVGLGRDQDALVGLLVVVSLVRIGRAIGSALPASRLLARWDERTIIVSALVGQGLGFLGFGCFATRMVIEPDLAYQALAGVLVLLISLCTGVVKPIVEVLRQACAPNRVKAVLISSMQLVATTLAAALIACSHLISIFFSHGNAPSLTLGFSFLGAVILAVVARVGPGLWRVEERPLARTQRTSRPILLGLTLGAIAIGLLHFALGRDLEIVRRVIGFGERYVQAELSSTDLWLTSWAQHAFDFLELDPTILVAKGAWLVVGLGHLLVFVTVVSALLRLPRPAEPIHDRNTRKARAADASKELRERLDGASVEIIDDSSAFAHILKCQMAGSPSATDDEYPVVWLPPCAASSGDSIRTGYLVVEHNPPAADARHGTQK